MVLTSLPVHAAPRGLQRNAQGPEARSVTVTLMVHGSTNWVSEQPELQTAMLRSCGDSCVHFAGGLAVMGFSNRCFPTKGVQSWHVHHDHFCCPCSQLPLLEDYTRKTYVCSRFAMKWCLSLTPLVCCSNCHLDSHWGPRPCMDHRWAFRYK